MNLYNKNLSFFQEKLCGIHDIVINNKPIYDISVHDLEEGENYIACNEMSQVYINSIYNVEREMKQIFKDVKDSTDTLIVFGFGCGYASDYINKNLLNIKHVYYIEPSLELFKKVMEIYDFNRMFVEGKKTITLLVNQQDDDLIQFVSNVIDNNYKAQFVYHVSYCSLFYSQYKLISECIAEIIRKNTVNLATETVVNYTWPHNIFNNLKANRNFLVDYWESMKGKVGILVSAGPSLEKNMHLLKDVHDRALIIAVGTAINILENNEIKPHVRFAIDGNPTEKNIFDGIDTSDVPIFYSNTLEKRILPEYEGGKVEFVLDVDKISRYVYDRSNIAYSIVRSGFSVANVAFDFFCRAGFSKVILMGQDLCYTKNKLYADGSWENSNVDLEKGGYVKQRDLYGEEVYTTSVFLGMKLIFEQLIELHPEIEVINATEGGLIIKNANNKSLKEVLDSLGSTDVGISRLVSELNAIKNFDEHKTKQNNINRIILDIKEENLEVFNMCEDVIKKMKKINRYKVNNIKVNRLLSELEHVEKSITQLYNNRFYNEVVKQSLDKTLKAIESNFYYSGTDKNDILEYKEKALFRRVLEIRKYTQMIKELIDEYLQ